MFRIGEFSRIAQVSARMLRHYDAIGLLHPARVDAQTGYRYYSARQLPRINRIVALRMIGLSLDEIGRIVGGVTAGEIRDIYQTRLADIEALLERERRRLILVQTRLRQLEETEFGAEVVLKRSGATPLLSLRETAADFAAMGALMAGVADACAAHRDLGPCLALFYDGDFEENGVDWEFGVVAETATPEALEIAGGRTLRRRLLPALELCASTLVEGGYGGLHQGYSALGVWIEANGYRIEGAGREIFWNYDRACPERNVTEIQFPVAIAHP